MSTYNTTAADDALLEGEDWLDRLIRVYRSRKEYGFAIYHHSALLAETKLGKIRARYKVHLNRAMLRADIRGYPFFALQTMRWPAHLQSEAAALARQTDTSLQISADDSSEDESDDEDEEVGDFEMDPLVNFDRGHRPNWLRAIERPLRVPNPSPTGGADIKIGLLSGRDADDELRNVFRELRLDFNQLRHQPRISPNDSVWSMSGYHDGLLTSMSDDCFVVVDPYSAYSWWDRPAEGGAPSSWVWVIDANFDEKDIRIKPRVNGVTEQYQGYLRVRLQQLPTTFFDAKRFRPDVTMQMLWEAARQSGTHAFVSLNPGQFHANDIVLPDDL